MLPTPTNSGGVMTLNVGVPVNPGWHGGSIFVQVVALDRPANFWGAVMSNGEQYQVIAPWSTPLPCGNVYLQGFGTSGNVRASEGYVVSFQ